MADDGNQRSGNASPPDARMRACRPELLHAMAHMLTRADRKRVIVYVLLSLGAALAGSVAAILLVPLVQPVPAHVFGGLLDIHASGTVLALAFGAAAAGFAVLRWFATRLSAGLISRYAMNLRCGVHARLIDAPLAALTGSTSAEIANVLTYNADIAAQGFSASLQLLVVAITSVVSLGFAFWVSPVLTLTLPALAGFGLIALRLYAREQSQVGRRYVEDLTRLFWQSEDFPRRQRHVRSFGRVEAEKADHDAISARLAHGCRRQLELVASGRLVLELLAAIGMVAAFMLALRWRGVDRASLIAVSLLLGRLLPYVVSTRQSLQQLRAAAPAFELWQRYASLESVRIDVPESDTTAVAGELRIERLRLTLPANCVEVNDLVLAPGELTLISGDSGIGKTSLVDVLAGMVMPATFAARIGGQPVGFDGYRKFVRKSAYVSQGVRPWQRTVRECLLWACPEATDEQLWRVLAEVGLQSRMAETQHGIETTLDNASNRFSGGEVQRLLLAQVILRRPCIALLDEATGSLDAASEMAVLATIKRRLPQAILIVVSHRIGVADIAEQHLHIGEDRVATIAKRGSFRSKIRA